MEGVYEKIFHLYPTPAALLKRYLSEKHKIAEDIAEFIRRDSSLFSLGSGLGVVESRLDEIVGIHATLLDKANNAHKFVLERRNFYVNRVIPDAVLYDTILLCQVIETYDDEQLGQILASLRTNLDTDGQLVDVFHSSDDLENGVERSLNARIRAWASRIILKYVANGQFLGWQRTYNEVRNSLETCGFSIAKQQTIEGQIILQAKKKSSSQECHTGSDQKQP